MFSCALADLTEATPSAERSVAASLSDSLPSALTAAYDPVTPIPKDPAFAAVNPKVVSIRIAIVFF